MKLLVLDNYDSFTYNLVHLIEKVSDLSFEVRKNDQIKLSEIKHFEKILLSPGPGLPSEAGIMPQLLKEYASTKSILGVCLGMQGIGENFDSPLKNLKTVYHGLASPIRVMSSDILFEGIPHSFKAGRYHSWVIDEHKINPVLQVTAIDDMGFIMAIKHKHYDVRGVQFHPESILSEYGENIIKNWLSHSLS